MTLPLNPGFLFLTIFCILANVPVHALIDELIVTKEMTESLKRIAPWKVLSYEENPFKGWTRGDFAGIFFQREDNLEYLIEEDGEDSLEKDVPDHFDARDHWPKCIHGIRNQGYCGSCYAHGAVQALSDRFCIKGLDVDLSVQDLVSCDPRATQCGGGSNPKSYRFLEEVGVVTESCIPYASEKGISPPCRKTCVHPEIPYKKYKCKSGSAKFTKKVAKMQLSILEDGPVTTMQRFCDDVTYYKSGIYSYTSGKCIGMHIMRTIGWGIEAGINYWIIANSFGVEWGEKGYIRFKMMECEIDHKMFYCKPEIPQ